MVLHLAIHSTIFSCGHHMNRQIAALHWKAQQTPGFQRLLWLFSHFPSYTLVTTLPAWEVAQKKFWAPIKILLRSPPLSSNIWCFTKYSNQGGTHKQGYRGHQCHQCHFWNFEHLSTQNVKVPMHVMCLLIQSNAIATVSSIIHNSRALQTLSFGIEEFFSYMNRPTTKFFLVLKEIFHFSFITCLVELH